MKNRIIAVAEYSNDRTTSQNFASNLKIAAFKTRMCFYTLNRAY